MVGISDEVYVNTPRRDALEDTFGPPSPAESSTPDAAPFGLHISPQPLVAHQPPAQYGPGFFKACSIPPSVSSTNINSRFQLISSDDDTCSATSLQRLLESHPQFSEDSTSSFGDSSKPFSSSMHRPHPAPNPHPLPGMTPNSASGIVREERVPEMTENQSNVLISDDKGLRPLDYVPGTFSVPPLRLATDLISELPPIHTANYLNVGRQNALRGFVPGDKGSQMHHRIPDSLQPIWPNHETNIADIRKNAQSRLFEPVSEGARRSRKQVSPYSDKSSPSVFRNNFDFPDFSDALAKSAELKRRCSQEKFLVKEGLKTSASLTSEGSNGLKSSSNRNEDSRYKRDSKKSSFHGGTGKCHTRNIVQSVLTGDLSSRGSPCLNHFNSNLSHSSQRKDHQHGTTLHDLSCLSPQKRRDTSRRTISEFQKPLQSSAADVVHPEMVSRANVQPGRITAQRQDDVSPERWLSVPEGTRGLVRAVTDNDVHQTSGIDEAGSPPKFVSAARNLSRFSCTVAAKEISGTDAITVSHNDPNSFIPHLEKVDCHNTTTHFADTSNFVQDKMANLQGLRIREKINGSSHQSLHLVNFRKLHDLDIVVLQEDPRKSDNGKTLSKHSQEPVDKNAFYAVEQNTNDFPKECRQSLEGENLSCLIREVAASSIRVESLDKIRRLPNNAMADNTTIDDKQCDRVSSKVSEASSLGKRSKLFENLCSKRPKIENNVEMQRCSLRTTAASDREISDHGNGLSTVTSILDSSIDAAVRELLQATGKAKIVTLEPSSKTQALSLDEDKRHSSLSNRMSRQDSGGLNELLNATANSRNSAYQTRVFMWDCERKVRSSDSFPVQDVLKIVMEDSIGKMFVYDGQDYNFNGLSSSRISEMLESDRSKWELRIACKETSKVRIWDTQSQDVLSYGQCPTISGLASFLHESPWCRVFHPGYIHETVDENAIETVCKGDALDKHFKIYEETVVDRQSRRNALCAVKKIISRIRWNCTTSLQETQLKEIVLWNRLTERVEEPIDFARRTALTIYLLRNSHLQLVQYHDKLRTFEQNTAFHLIPIYLHCPIKFACLWDAIRQERKINPCESEFLPGTTLGDIVGPFSPITIYAGQDLVEAPFVKEVIRVKLSRGSIPWQHMLANCGMNVQREVYDHGWIPNYIDSNLWPCSRAVYWDDCSGSIGEGCDQQACQFVKDHLSIRHGTVQLYSGQNLCAETRNDLKRWFDLLHFKPGSAASCNSAVLLRPWMTAGIDPRTVDWARPSHCFKRRQRDHEHDFEGSYDRNKKRVKSSETAIIDQDVEIIDIENAPAEKNDGNRSELLTMTGALSVAAQPIPLDEDDGSCSKPRTRAESGRPKVCSGVVHDNEQDKSKPDTRIENGVVAKVSRAKLLELAHKKVSRLVGSIREAGPKIFRGELTRDLRHQLREELVHHVESVKGLLLLLTRVEAEDFPCMAWELYERVEAMDTWQLFQPCSEASLGPPPLKMLRRDILKGRICLATEVISRFQQMCHQHMLYYGESMVGNAASEMLRYGQELFCAFSIEYRKSLDLEEKVIKIGEICEAASKVGFLKQAGKRRARLTGSLKMSVKVSIRVAGSEPMVTFMNCRDEKGHAVMGKQQSVRILGLSIDVRECERRIGQIQHCHICYDEVREGAGGLLKCSNWVFDFCHEVVCRTCAEQVLSIDFAEFCRLREREKWFCPHCQGLCSLDSMCHSNQNDLKKKKYSERVVRLWWRNLNWEARIVRMNLVRRSLSGAFCDSDSRVIELYQSAKDSNLWERTVKLPIGAYRCGVFLDDVEVASTCFQVYGGMVEGGGQARKYHSLYGESKQKTSEGEREASFTAGASGGVKDGFTESRSKHSRPRIKWDISPNVFVHGAKVKSWQSRTISEKDEGHVIEMCSRTEGYDWRRAKYHPIQMWVPHVIENVDKEENVDRDVVYCTNEWMWRDWVRRDRPEASCGITYREATVKWNTYMYSRMLEKLWGIVAGRSEIHGIGLFTLTGYERGEMVIEYAGDLIRTALGDVREGEYQNAGLGTYLFKLNDEQIVDATVNSNRARFTNHSCDPNMMADVITIAGRELVVLRATRRIPKYAELTFDYQLPYEDDEKLHCLCNSANCVGVMN